MKRFVTITDYVALKYIVWDSEGDRIKGILDGDGNAKIFKTRKEAKNYCVKHRLMYVERKHIFYR